MNTTEKYFDIQQQLEYSNYELKNLIERNVDSTELNAAKARNNVLQLEFNTLNQELSLQDTSSDNIRLNFIQYTNEVLKTITKIEGYSNCFPDLDQNMVIPGYLFSSILSEYKFILKVGGGYPIPQIYMSQKEWPATDFKILLTQIRNELTEIKFTSFKDTITYYERIVDRIKTHLAILQKLGYV